MLDLARQNSYRRHYQAINPGWRSGCEQYELMVRRSIVALKQQRAGAINILDLGCGAGGVIEHVSRDVTLAVGIDGDRGSLARHRDRVTRLATGRLERLPVKDGQFDLVISSWVLEHAEHPAALFAEVARALRSGGRFIFLTPNIHNIVTGINRLAPRLLQRSLVRTLYGRDPADTFPVTYRANAVEYLDRAAIAAGLRPAVIRTVSDPTYLAFNDWLFALSILFERKLPAQNYVHIVGECLKEAA